MGIHSSGLQTYLKRRYKEFEFATRSDGQEDVRRVRYYARFIGEEAS